MASKVARSFPLLIGFLFDARLGLGPGVRLAPPVLALKPALARRGFVLREKPMSPHTSHSEAVAAADLEISRSVPFVSLICCAECGFVLCIRPQLQHTMWPTSNKAFLSGAYSGIVRVRREIDRVKVRQGASVVSSHQLQVMRVQPRGCKRSVDRGVSRPAVARQPWPGLRRGRPGAVVDERGGEVGLAPGSDEAGEQGGFGRCGACGAKG